MVRSGRSRTSAEPHRYVVTGMLTTQNGVTTVRATALLAGIGAAWPGRRARRVP
jgi:hypothetical protein